MKIDKSYIPFFITLALVTVAVVLSKPEKKTSSVKSSLNQYENRIKEFYSGVDLAHATHVYKLLVSSGMNPSDAYKIIGCE